MNIKCLLITPSVGRTVHFVLPNGEHRAAVIVRVFDAEPTPRSLANLQVFLDGSNDDRAVGYAPDHGHLLWRTSVHQDADTFAPGSYHAPEPIPAAS